MLNMMLVGPCRVIAVIEKNHQVRKHELHGANKIT